MANEHPPLRVLIVADEAPARSRLRDLLTDLSAEIPLEIAREGGNGREAIDFLSAHPVDVVLLDIRMPEIDGIEVAQHLQKLAHAHRPLRLRHAQPVSPITLVEHLQR